MKRKKSKITDWWVARSNLKMAFVNILSGKPIDVNDNLLVVGYLDKDKKQLATSTNRVVKITKKGAITAKGTFYPFEEAHELYLQFLIDANKKNTLIATNWDYCEGTNQGMIIADIIRDESIEKDIVFDFTPSKNIKSNFGMRNFLIILCIPDEVESAIYKSSFATRDEIMKKVKKVQKIFKKRC